jgi:hypothetical protein
MPYAAENTVSQNTIKGGIKISDAQYKKAVAAQIGGQSITIQNGSLVILSSIFKTVYSTIDKTGLEIPENALVPSSYSDIKPSEFDEYINGAWVINLDLQKGSKREELKSVRSKALSDIKHALKDGSIYQVRPSDLSNFVMAIQEGKREDWVLDDNTVRLTTVAEMQECLKSGIEQGKSIWRKHTAALQALNKQELI